MLSQFWHTGLLSVDLFSLACFFLSLKNLHVAVSVSVHFVVMFAGNETKKLLYHQQSPCFLCPHQGEGSAEWVGTADPGWLRGSLSFSRYKGKGLTSPLPPSEKCCWKLFSVIVIGFNLILHLDLISLCFRSYFRKQTSLPSCRVLGIFLAVSVEWMWERNDTLPLSRCAHLLQWGLQASRGMPQAINVWPYRPEWGSVSISPRLLVICWTQKVCVVFRESQAQAVCWHAATKFVSGLLSTDTNLG